MKETNCDVHALLIFVAIAIGLEVLASNHHRLICIASSLAILPLAGWMGHAVYKATAADSSSRQMPDVLRIPGPEAEVNLSSDTLPEPRAVEQQRAFLEPTTPAFPTCEPSRPVLLPRRCRNQQSEVQRCQRPQLDVSAWPASG